MLRRMQHACALNRVQCLFVTAHEEPVAWRSARCYRQTAIRLLSGWRFAGQGAEPRQLQQRIGAQIVLDSRKVDLESAALLGVTKDAPGAS